MKVFTSANSPWDTKVNFVDSNNVLVGFDTACQCCENFGWYLSEDRSRTPSYEDLTDPETLDPETLVDYTFDTNFFERVSSYLLEEGSLVRFRLTAPGEPDVFLNLFNAHNGYYSHGFTVSAAGVEVSREYI